VSAIIVTCINEPPFAIPVIGVWPRGSAVSALSP
jgi:hypothetical protein